MADEDDDGRWIAEVCRAGIKSTLCALLLIITCGLARTLHWTIVVVFVASMCA